MELKKKDLKIGDILKTKAGEIYIYLGDYILNINNGSTIKAEVYDDNLNHFSENKQIYMVAFKPLTDNWKNFILKENQSAWDWERSDEVKYIGLRETAESKEEIYIISKKIEINKGDIVKTNNKKYIVTDVGIKDATQLNSIKELTNFEIDKI